MEEKFLAEGVSNRPMLEAERLDLEKQGRNVVDAISQHGYSVAEPDRDVQDLSVEFLAWGVMITGLDVESIRLFAALYGKTNASIYAKLSRVISVQNEIAS